MSDSSRDEASGSEGPPASVDPVPNEPAAVATVGDERALVIADYHAGYEAGLRYERGVDVPSRAADRRERLVGLLERTRVDRLIVLGDLMHSIGQPGGAERGELEVLVESLPPAVAVTIAKGNHDGEIETWLAREPHGRSGSSSEDDARAAGLEIVPGAGGRLGELGICHGHTWPAPHVLEAATVCVGHEHPFVRLEDEVGGSRVEPAWLRGRFDPEPFLERPEYEGLSWLEGGDSPRLIVVPAFNDLVGGTWINVPGQSFLAPFLPDGMARSQAYLLDGTRLGPYESV